MKIFRFMSLDEFMSFLNGEHVVEVIYEQLDKVKWLNRFGHYNQVANTPRAAKVKQEVVK